MNDGTRNHESCGEPEKKAKLQGASEEVGREESGL
jgi:hypothetical protein